MFTLQSSSKYSPFDAVHLMETFPTAQNSFWIHRVWCLQCFCHFLFVLPIPHLQNVSLWELFNVGKQKNSCLWQEQENRKGGAQGSCHFGWKTAKCSVCCRQVGAFVIHPSQNGQMHWKNIFKKLTEAECSFSQHHQLVHWYRWVLRTLT